MVSNDKKMSYNTRRRTEAWLGFQARWAGSQSTGSMPASPTYIKQLEHTNHTDDNKNPLAANSDDIGYVGLEWRHEAYCSDAIRDNVDGKVPSRLQPVSHRFLSAIMIGRAGGTFNMTVTTNQPIFLQYCARWQHRGEKRTGSSVTVHKWTHKCLNRSKFEQRTCHHWRT